VLCIAGLNAGRAREYFRIKENHKFKISSKNLDKLKIRELFLSALPEKHWLNIRDMKKGFHEDSAYWKGGHDKRSSLWFYGGQRGHKNTY